MIISENIVLDIIQPFDNSFIEKELKIKGLDPLRWAVIDACDKNITVSVSYLKNT